MSESFKYRPFESKDEGDDFSDSSKKAKEARRVQIVSSETVSSIEHEISGEGPGRMNGAGSNGQNDSAAAQQSDSTQPATQSDATQQTTQSDQAATERLDRQRRIDKARAEVNEAYAEAEKEEQLRLIRAEIAEISRGEQRRRHHSHRDQFSDSE
ncbi:MAG TPA: hypothetical protein VFA41_04755 [Ktedonobacteraceae bacterium]|jgi:hypothetical protein|nr:hypothetical protein [Ktedonobacteraceae bacterium]